jgi:hypothetical protein
MVAWEEVDKIEVRLLRGDPIARESLKSTQVVGGLSGSHFPKAVAKWAYPSEPLDIFYRQNHQRGNYEGLDHRKFVLCNCTEGIKNEMINRLIEEPSMTPMLREFYACVVILAG